MEIVILLRHEGVHFSKAKQRHVASSWRCNFTKITKFYPQKKIFLSQILWVLGYEWWSLPLTATLRSSCYEAEVGSNGGWFLGRKIFIQNFGGKEPILGRFGVLIWTSKFCEKKNLYLSRPCWDQSLNKTHEKWDRRKIKIYDIPPWWNFDFGRIFDQILDFRVKD